MFYFDNFYSAKWHMVTWGFTKTRWGVAKYYWRAMSPRGHLFFKMAAKISIYILFLVQVVIFQQCLFHVMKYDSGFSALYPLKKTLYEYWNGIILYCIVLYCIVLYWIILYCTVIQWRVAKYHWRAFWCLLERAPFFQNGHQISLNVYWRAFDY